MDRTLIAFLAAVVCLSHHVAGNPGCVTECEKKGDDTCDKVKGVIGCLKDPKCIAEANAAIGTWTTKLANFDSCVMPKPAGSGQAVTKPTTIKAPTSTAKSSAPLTTSSMSMLLLCAAPLVMLRWL